MNTVYTVSMYNDRIVDTCASLEKARAIVEVYVWENMYSNIEGDNEFLRVDYEIHRVNNATGEKTLIESTKGRRLIPDWR